ncbi:MAG: DUF4190 domain-containing protein [Candidatus Omnitrophota bacterium]
MAIKPQRTIITKQQPKKNISFFGIASLLCGCFFLWPVGIVLGIVAIILGIIAFVQISKDKDEERKGIGFAIGGIALGVLSLLNPLLVRIAVELNAPAFLRVNREAQESAAAAAMRSIYTAETSHRLTYQTYITLDQFGSAGSSYIDSNLACAQPTCFQYDYAFNVVVAGPESFFVTAQPKDLSLRHTYYIDESGVLCRSDAVGTAKVQTHADSGCPVGFSKVKEVAPAVISSEDSGKKPAKEKPWQKKR